MHIRLASDKVLGDGHKNVSIITPALSLRSVSGRHFFPQLTLIPVGTNEAPLTGTSPRMRVLDNLLPIFSNFFDKNP